MLFRSVSNDSAHLSPFLAKYKWHEIVGDTLPLDIKGWISAPQDAEQELLGLTGGVQEYYSKIVQTILLGFREVGYGLGFGTAT